MQIDDHTITFSVDNGRNSLIPPIPIRLQNWIQQFLNKEIF
jgi:hypothetical protein